MKFKKVIFISLLFIINKTILYSSNLDLSLSYAKNSSERKGFDFLINFEFKNLEFRNSIRYFKKDNSYLSNNGFSSIRYDIQISTKWTFWFFERASYDKIQKINFQNNFGSGLKYTFFMTTSTRFDFSSGILYDFIDYDTKTNSKKYRISNRLRYETKLNPISLSIVNFYQPDIKDFNDFIIISNLSISHKISDLLSLKFKLENTHRSKPAVSFYNDFYTNLFISIDF